jgi:hypothetical protein
MEVVGVGETPVQTLGEKSPDGRLSRSDYSHDDENQRSSCS